MIESASTTEQRLLLTNAHPQVAPAAQEPRPARKSFQRLFSFPVVLGTLLVLLTTFTVRSRFNDPDLWWHLKTGEIIWNTHSIPTVDAFSFTVAGHSRPPQEWLSEVSMYAAWKIGGYTGLMLWLCVLASLLVTCAYLLSSLYSGNVKVAFLGGLIIWLFSTVGLAIRPHIIGYLLLICELLFIHLGRTRTKKWLFGLPPMFALWVNVHSSFIFGLAVLAIFLFCSFLDLRWGLLVSHGWETQRRRALAIAFVLSIAALFTNPVGLKQITYPVVAMGTMPLSLHSVSEWLPPSFESPRSLALLLVAGLVLLIPMLRRNELYIAELLLVTMGFGLAVRHERMVFVFGILVAPVICRLLADAWEPYESSGDAVLPNLIILSLLVPTIGIAFPARSSLEQQVREGNPVHAVEFLKRSGLSGRMLNEYGYGGYLIWAAPEYKVFIDGRGDVFEWAGVFSDYSKLMALQADPQSTLKKYHINFCLLPVEQPLARMLPLLPDWKRIYSDKVSVVFAKSGAMQ